MKLPISFIVLTFNEEKNLEDCLKSIRDWVGEIFVVDSYSTDQTLEIAKKYGARIAEHPFKTQAEQFNWALDNLDIKNDWILRLDADERMTEELWRGIVDALKKVPDEVNGFYFKRKVYFMGRWIKHGGYYPVWLLRLFHKGKGRSEEKEMDEHIVLSDGRSEMISHDFIHDDHKEDLKAWVEKHNNYSTREAGERLKLKKESEVEPRFLSSQMERKRWLKTKLYGRLPLFSRAFLYFIYRYFIRLGFLDGKEGLIFHFLQGCWHQFLIDAKIYEQIKMKYEKGKR